MLNFMIEWVIDYAYCVILTISGSLKSFLQCCYNACRRLLKTLRFSTGLPRLERKFKARNDTLFLILRNYQK
ncbi:MAG: hypothetical protein J6U05_04150 [Neisseriaceae bacterium]|nr:hypothetical protein [Neisseriaceae bacterium]